MTVPAWLPVLWAVGIVAGVASNVFLFLLYVRWRRRAHDVAYRWQQAVAYLGFVAHCPLDEAVLAMRPELRRYLQECGVGVQVVDGPPHEPSLSNVDDGKLRVM